MWRLLLYAFLIWFLYNLIFRFIIPIYRTTRQVRKQFREMHQKMEEQTKQQQGFTNGTEVQKPSSAKPAGDYIDFEEIK